MPAVQIWGRIFICHKYEGMTGILTGTMMEELALALSHDALPT